MPFSAQAILMLHEIAREIAIETPALPRLEIEPEIAFRIALPLQDLFHIPKGHLAALCGHFLQQPHDLVSSAGIISHPFYSSSRPTIPSC